MKNSLLCRLNASRDGLFRSAKTETHQTEQISCGLPGLRGHVARPLLRDRGHAINESADDPCRQGLVLDHRQMTAISQKNRLHLGQELRYPQLMRRRNDGVLGSDDIEHRPPDLG